MTNSIIVFGTASLYLGLKVDVHGCEAEIDDFGIDSGGLTLIAE